MTEDAQRSVIEGAVVLTGAVGDGVFAVQSGSGTYGTLEIIYDSGLNRLLDSWRYTLDNTLPATNDLVAGQKVTDTFEITETNSGTTATVVITITGADDASQTDRLPSRRLDSKVKGLTGTVTRGAAGGLIRDQITLDSANLRRHKVGPDTFVVQKSTQGKYGRFTIDATGNWVYQLRNDYPTTVALTEEATDSFRVYRLSRVYGQTPPRTGVYEGNLGPRELPSQRVEYLEYQVVITIEVPSISITGDLTGAVRKDSPTENMASGTVRVAGVPGAIFRADGPGSSYGTFTINEETGAWTYTLDNSRAITQGLDVIRGTTETIAIAVGANNLARANIVITINPPPALSAPIIGGNFKGAVTADATRITTTDYDLGCRPLNENDGTSLENCAGRGTSTGSGTETKRVLSNTARGAITLIVAAVDDGTPPPTLVEATQRGRFGSLETINGGTVTPAGGNRTYRYGAWFYTLDNDLAATNALAAGQSRTDPFAIQFSDGTTAQVVITVTGADDPSTISGILTGAVTEDDLARSTATGTVTVNDVDVPSTATIRAQRTVGTYGHFSIDANGDWAYDIGNLFPATEALGPSSTVEDRFVIRSSDGGAAIVIITVTGAQDSITGGGIGGQLRGIVTKAGGRATGVATSTKGDDAFVSQLVAPGTYGVFTITPAGEWVYMLDDDEAAIDALARGGRGERVTDDFEIGDGGSVGKVTILITRFLQQSTISGDLQGSVTEDDPARNRATGRVTVAHVDTSRTPKIIVSTDAPGSYEVVEDGSPPYDEPPGSYAGIYGSFSIDEDGNWTYDLDDSKPITNALREAQTETDTFTIEASDGTTAKVTITITGADDVSRLGGALKGFVSKRDTTRYRTQGTVTPIDSDNGPVPLLTEQSDVSGVYGSFSIQANGVWTYDLDLERSGDHRPGRRSNYRCKRVLRLRSLRLPLRTGPGRR